MHISFILHLMHALATKSPLFFTPGVLRMYKLTGQMFLSPNGFDVYYTLRAQHSA